MSSIKLITLILISVGKGKFPTGGCPVMVLMRCGGGKVSPERFTLALTFLVEGGVLKLNNGILTLTESGERLYDDFLKVFEEEKCEEVLELVRARPDLTKLNLEYAERASGINN